MKLVRPQKISDQVLSVLEGRIVEGVYAEGARFRPNAFWRKSSAFRVRRSGRH